MFNSYEMELYSEVGRSCLIRIAICKTNRLFILLERAEKEIRFSMANGMFKTKMDINRHSPRLMPNNCKNLSPPYFSLPTTFKDLFPVCESFFKKVSIYNFCGCLICEKFVQVYSKS